MAIEVDNSPRGPENKRRIIKARPGPKSSKGRTTDSGKEVEDAGDSDGNLSARTCRSEESKSSRSESVSLGGTTRRKRGRPETTGEWRKKKEQMRLRLLEDERQEEEEIVDPEIPPKTRTTNQSRAESEFAEEF